MYGTGDEQISGLIGNKGWTSLQSFKQCSNFQQFFYLQHCVHEGKPPSLTNSTHVPPRPMGNTQYIRTHVSASYESSV